MIIKQIFTEPETEVKWYFDSIEEIVIIYIKNRLRGTFACACYTLHLRLALGSGVRTAPPVSVKVRVRVSVSFSFTVLCFEFD